MGSSVFKAGGLVVVKGAGACGEERVERVKRVLKRFVELEDGTRWSHLGRKYPRPKTQSYFPPCIRVCTYSGARLVERMRCVRVISGTRGDAWQRLSDADLKAACELAEKAAELGGSDVE